MKSSSPKHLPFWSRVAGVAVSLLTLWIVFRRVDVLALTAVLLATRLVWFVGALLLFGTAFLLAACRWHLVLRLSGCSVHAWATFQTAIIGHFFNTLLFGPAGGDVAKAALYARWYRHSTAAILVTCFLDRLLGGVGFVLFGLLGFGLAGLGDRFPLAQKSSSFHSRGWMVLVVGLALGALVWILHRRLRRRSPLENLLHTFRTGAKQLLVHPRQTALGVLFAFLGHFCMSGMLLFCLQSVTRQTLSLAELLWVFLVISLVSSVPITFAGTGLREGAALVLLGLYGIPAADAVAASLLVFAVYLVWATVAGIWLWREEKKFRTGVQRPEPQTISVVIPTLNEAANLPDTIASVRQLPEVNEIIVVDGGSDDQTRSIGEQLGCRVLASPPGRGGQMRVGALNAHGNVILLLHADTWLPREAGRAVLDCFRDRTVVGGGFWKVFRDQSLLMTGSRFRCALRLYLWRRVAGDQAIFVRRDVLEAVGGVPDMALMEEFELCRRLREIGRLALAGATVTTSARRFAKLGILRTYLRMWRVTLQYYCGTPVKKLERLYDKK